MDGLDAAALLATWEAAQGAHPLRRALALLAAAWPGREAQWAALPIGRRDAWLFALHDALFGAPLDTVAACPECGETLELAFTSAEVRPSVGDDGEVQGTLEAEGCTLDYRLPGSADLLEALDHEDAATCLLERCVSAARRSGTAIAVEALPAAAVESLQDEMARRDPGADLRIALACAACGHAFERRFDIADYLWAEVDDWAERTLAEVHALARAYGWSEPQVLALSAARRRRYLEMVQG